MRIIRTFTFKNSAFAATLVFTVSALFTSHLYAGSEDDAIAYYTMFYEQSQKNLEDGNAREKVDAAILFGAHLKTNYVRPLNRELVRFLDDPAMRKLPEFGAYTKTMIAWSVGQIAQKDSVPYLQEALTKSMKLMDSDNEAIQKNEKRSRDLGDQYSFFLIKDRPGPALLKEETQFPYNPDLYWSVSDDVKHIISLDINDEGIRTLLKGYNYVNLVVTVIDSLGTIGGKYYYIHKTFDPDGDNGKLVQGIVETMNNLLQHQNPYIRSAAVRAMGVIRSPEGMSTLTALYDKEQNDQVKTYICRSILQIDKTQYKYYKELLNSLKSPNRLVRLEAAVSFRGLAMGEAIFNLKEAITLEESPIIRGILKDAIYNSEVDNLLPVNY